MKNHSKHASERIFMRTFNYIVCTLIVWMNISICNAQTIPQYELSIQNPVLNGTVYQFDIFIKRIGATNFRLGNSQCIMSYNVAHFVSPVLSRVSSSEQIGNGYFFDQVLQDGKLLITLGGNGSYANASDIANSGVGTKISTYQITEVNVAVLSPQLLWINVPAMIRTGVSEIDISDNYRDITDLSSASHINGGGEFAKLSGYTFNDLNGNGTWDQLTEPPLNGWTIMLAGIGSSFSAFTGFGTWPTGYFEFVNLTPGEYTLDEVPQTNWSKTVSPLNPIVLASGNDFQNYNFGNYNGPAIIGSVFNDKNGNRIKDLTEAGLSGWTITATKTGGGGSKTATTNGNGLYSFVFSPVDAGEWEIAQTVQSGWMQTLPEAPQHYTFDIQSGTYETGVDFGNFKQCEVFGYKFNDFNRDSIKETFETFISNWKIHLFKNGTHYDSMLTDANGMYKFSSLLPGSYTITEQNLFGWSQTVPPPPGYYSFTIDTGGVILTGKNFGNFHILPVGGIGRIMGRKFEDRIQNGQKDLDDAGVPNWRIRLSVANSVIDSALTDQNGDYIFEDLEDGIYTVSESSINEWTQTYPVGQEYYDVELNPTQRTVTARDFGNYHFGSASGKAYNDMNHNGQCDQGELGLAGIPITLVGSTITLQTTTVAGGGWSFTGLSAGEYSISESIPSGHHVTAPVNNIHLISILSGMNVTSLDFGNSVSTDTVKFRTISYDSFAYGKDQKGRIGKSIKKIPDKVEFVSMMINNTGQAIGGMDIHFNPPLIVGDTTKPLVITPTPTTIINVSSPKNAHIKISWNDSLSANDTVMISGWGRQGKLEKIRYSWDGIRIINKHYEAQMILNQPRLPMPNVLNVRDDAFKLGGFKTSGLIVGTPDIENKKIVGWVALKSVAAIQTSFMYRMVIHSRVGRGYDVFENGREFIGEQKTLRPQRQNNRLFADLATLKLNITASELQILRSGLGELVFDDGINPLSGYSLRDLAARADSALTYWHLYTADDFINLDTTIRKILYAFEGPIDTVSFGQQLVLTGVKKLLDVPFLRAIAGVSPVIRETGISSESLLSQPEKIELLQNYPNPFNPITTIQFVLPNPAVVTLKIYNIIGMEVATLIDQVAMDDEFQEVEFDARNYASGVYFYKLVANQITDDEQEIMATTFTSVKKMILLK
jgi:hypothetical protein